MKSMAPTILGPGDTVTLRCRDCGSPTQFVRNFGAGGQVTCTPLSVEGRPTCVVCTPDEEIAEALNAGLDVEMQN